MELVVTAFGVPILLTSWKKGKRKGRRKEMGYRVFPGVNRIGRPKAMTSLSILPRYYRQF